MESLMKKFLEACKMKRSIAWLLVTIIIASLAIPTGMNAIAGTSKVEISESAGWLESAYAEWAPVTNATGYNVYYKSASAADTTYIKLDNMLIRQYDTYYRADALGLTAGEYVFKIVPIISGVEDVSKQVTSATLIVEAHTREGFAFSASSTAKTGSGGYNDDGTVPTDAQIIYLTEQNKNTLTASVITSSNGTKTVCTGIGAVLSAREKGYDTRHLIIRVIGKVTEFASANVNFMQVKATKNMTIEGVGEDATAYNWGILIRGCTNIEVRNLGIMMFPDDGISLDTNNSNIWVHNNDIFYGKPGSDADQVKGDGACDIKANSTYVTVSYNHFWDSGKSSLCGMSDTAEFFVTYHHNWYDHSDSRHARIRVATVHIYNNYFDGNAKYGVGVTKGSSAFVESNYFRNCKYPMLSSLQGTDIFFGSANATFSGENGGMIKSFGNIIIGATRFADQTTNTSSFDAITTSTRDEQVSSNYTTVAGGTTYNNFDTAATMYSYKVDTAEVAKTKVEKYAGRMNGGDFKWTFNNDVDDHASDINTGLKTAILNYSNKLLTAGGITVVGQETTTVGATQATTQATTQGSAQTTTQSSTETTTSGNATSPTYVHNFDTGLTDTFFTITGNLSTSKGTVTYNGLTIKQCLKMESATSITFNAPSSGILTLVFVESTANAYVNNTKLTATNGIITVNVPAGANLIKKADTNNLFYIGLAIEGETTSVTPTQATTVAPTQATTVAPTQATTVAPTQATTVAPTQATTVAPTQATTVAPTQATTVAPTQATTETPTEATTAAPTEATTTAPVKSPAVIVENSSIVPKENVESVVKDAGEKEVKVSTKNAPVVSKELLENLKSNDKKVSVQVTNESNELLYTWIFNGSTISNSDLAIDTSISFTTDKKADIEKLTNDSNVLYMSFAYHGELPGPTEIIMYVGDKYKNGDIIYLYYYNETTQKVELVRTTGFVVTNGYVKYTITHCSIYFLSDNQQLVNDSSNSKSSASAIASTQSAENTTVVVATSDKKVFNVYIYAIILSAGIITVLYSVSRRKKQS